jgi:hypothetical protein
MHMSVLRVDQAVSLCIVCFGALARAICQELVCPTCKHWRVLGRDSAKKLGTAIVPTKAAACGWFHRQRYRGCSTVLNRDLQSYGTPI